MTLQSHIIKNLDFNVATFAALVNGATEDEYFFKPDENSWCMLEVLCHLIDEEVEDFRTRVRMVLESPSEPLPKINPTGWVKERNYIERDFKVMVKRFMAERKISIDWLNSLKTPDWQHTHIHPKLGPVTANYFLENWLAHDYLHIRQITRLRYQYLQKISLNTLQYAGNW